MALSAVDSLCDWSDGRVCFAVAAGYHKDAAFHSLYVQGNEFDFCVAVFNYVVWRSHHLEQCHRGGHYRNRHHFVCQGIVVYGSC